MACLPLFYFPFPVHLFYFLKHSCIVSALSLQLCEVQVFQQSLALSCQNSTHPSEILPQVIVNRVDVEWFTVMSSSVALQAFWFNIVISHGWKVYYPLGLFLSPLAIICHRDMSQVSHPPTFRLLHLSTLSFLYYLKLTREKFSWSKSSFFCFFLSFPQTSCRFYFQVCCRSPSEEMFSFFLFFFSSKKCFLLY